MSVRRGEIYFVDLNPASGREQAGRRPVLVVSNDTLNARPLVVAVITSMLYHT
jgi:mRNA interferase MazF